jgi:hypothetical protein
MHILAPIYESKEEKLYAADFVRQSDYVDLCVNGGNSSVDHSSAVKKKSFIGPTELTDIAR